jgi:hypothetical protein
MSLLCQASYSILALQDKDLLGLNLVPTHSDLDKQLTERHIDIKLECNFTGSGPGNSNSKLDVVSWNNGLTDLCGSCSFCILLGNGIQQSVESDQWYGWNLSSMLDPTTLSQPFELPATAHFKKLGYQKHLNRRTPKTVDTRSTGKYWEVNLLLLDGYVLVYLADKDSGKEPKRIKVPLAFELFGEVDDPVVQLLGIHRRPLYGPRFSDENFAKMHSWIKDCDESHDRCFPALQRLGDQEVRSSLPTRLIDVGDTLEKHPRLIITSEMPIRNLKDEGNKYVALSYCWGKLDAGTKLLKTTSGTIHTRTEKIEMSTMPQAFQDAIIVARKLSIPYLWIDSLCIIQDDAIDWQTESSKMADIFSNAYLTLIAATGSGCNDSFLSRGSAGLSCMVPLGFDHGLVVQGHFFLRFRPHRGPYDKMTEMRSSKWVTRGWTFQEERLARRALIFGERKFFFDCRSAERSQDTDRYLSRPDWVTSVTEGLGENHVATTELSRHWDHWQTLCTHYSYRELTFPEDKLPAISGMANKIGKKVKSEYLAGLWRENFVYDLFWETVDIGIKPQKYRAPSWSWASLDGKIIWPLQHDARIRWNLYTTILDAKTTLLGVDTYGGVKDGYLKVRGVIEEMEVMWNAGDRNWRLHHEREEIGEVNLDMNMNMDDKTVQVHGRPNLYQALLVIGYKAPREGKAITRGLLLKRNDLKREGCEEFERVGTFALLPGIVPDHYVGYHGLWGSHKEQVIMIV